jgi:hypothetical protein
VGMWILSIHYLSSEIYTVPHPIGPNALSIGFKQPKCETRH